MRIRSPRDFWSGLMFFSVGLAAMLWSLLEYRMGTALRMGPGYFPAMVGGLLALVGLVVLARSVRVSGAAIGRVRLRPVALVIVAILAYGYLMKPLGLVLATLVLVVVAALASRAFRWREVLALGLVLVLFSSLIFVKALSLPFPLCPAAVDHLCAGAFAQTQAQPARHALGTGPYSKT